MEWWDDFLLGRLPYQHYWLPLALGVAAGMLCLTVAGLLSRWRQSWGRHAISPAESLIADSNRPVHDPFVQGSYSESRKSLRRRGNLVEVLYARAENRGIVRRGVVMDRSIGGLRLTIDEKVEPTTHLMVLPVNASDLVPWIEVEVRTCTQVEDSWELGCQFLKTPQWSILLLFG